MVHLASFVSLLQFFFAPHGQPWWSGAVWGNVVAIVPCGLIGYVWTKYKLFPLNLIDHKLTELHRKHDDLHVKIDALHVKHDDLHTKIDALASVSGGGTSNPN